MLEVFKQIRWQDIFDIFLVTIIFYRLLLIFKGTKAAKMLLGLVVLLLVSFGSKHFELYTMDWLIQSFLSQLVIAIIVLFQPEIRRVLAQMGEARLFQTFTSAEEMKSIDEIVRATVSLSNKRIGALMVIERETSLQDYIEVGIPLDSRVSKEILLSIFHPTSPIHDGAVIIKANRIIAAGCFLPITLESDLSKTLGTRHRAGLGVTNETDAVVIIVSEETGAISYAINGRLFSNITMNDLRDRLTDLFTKKKDKKR
ncbi:MAG: diadenylate cyclase CdaA [Thermodesulfovibrionales bacterium]